MITLCDTCQFCKRVAVTGMPNCKCTYTPPDNLPAPMRGCIEKTVVYIQEKVTTCVGYKQQDDICESCAYMVKHELGRSCAYYNYRDRPAVGPATDHSVYEIPPRQESPCLVRSPAILKPRLR